MIGDRLIPPGRLQAATFALLFASLASVALLYTRPLLFGKTAFGYLPWNLVLAWIPLLFALAVYRFYNRAAKPRLLLTGCAFVWFVFFPNAPYILTDLVHLKKRKPVPFWFDIQINLNFALTAFFIGYLSLYLMQEIVAHRAGKRAGWVFALGMLWLSGFGIYLGRFLRWNSWDILVRPGGLFGDVWEHLTEPFTHPEALAFWFTLSLFLMMTYAFLHAFAHLHQPPADSR